MISGRYNDTPEEFVKISENAFAGLFFTYIFKQYEFRQLKDHEMSNAKLFELDYSSGEGLGVAMVKKYEKKGKKIHFYRFGSSQKWVEFTTNFARQFTGDNS